MAIKPAFAFIVFSIVWCIDIYSVIKNKGLVEFIMKFACLEGVSMNFSIIFFGISIYRLYYRSKKLSVLYQDMLYLISFSLTSTSVFIN